MTYRHREQYEQKKPSNPPPSNTFWCRGCNKGKAIAGRKLTPNGWRCKCCHGGAA